MRTEDLDVPVDRDISWVRMEHLAMVTNHLSASTVFFFFLNHIFREITLS